MERCVADSGALLICCQGKFEILPSQEDGHTAIEQYLTAKYGELGKKIHTGRSRNDQSLVMVFSSPPML